MPAANRNVTNHDNLKVDREELTDEQREALTNQHVRKYEAALTAKKLADAEMKNVCKIAKADGVPLAEIKAYIDARTPEGQARLLEDAERVARMARWFKFATQASLFGDDDTPAPVGNKSYRLGKEAGMNGEQPKPPDTVDHETWMQGWNAGQTQMASLGIKQIPEETNTGDEFDA